MEIAHAQKDVRETFLGGFVGQLVAAVLWGISAATSTSYSLHMGEVVLLLGGFLIFPLTQLALRSMGHAYALPKGHPMNALAVQIAFTLPLTLPLAIGPPKLCLVISSFNLPQASQLLGMTKGSAPMESGCWT